MKIFYHPEYNIDIGLLNLFHPFDGKKFSNVVKQLIDLPGIEIEQPIEPISQDSIDLFADSLLTLLLHKKRYILKALEVPYIPLLPFSLIDKRVLLPMRWGVAGTLAAAREALNGHKCWNLSGGYHHASRASAEGFCIYNDIGISVDLLQHEGKIDKDTKILIIDIDAHHGNGNSYVFHDDKNVTILDIYNNDIYPVNNYTKERVDINIPLAAGTNGFEYLSKLNDGLSQLTTGFDLAFVIAGTDVIQTDSLGGLVLTLEDCLQRDTLVFEKLSSLSIPFVFLGGGGYSQDSAKAMIQSLSKLYKF